MTTPTPTPQALEHAARGFCHLACIRPAGPHDDACAWYGTSEPVPDRLPQLLTTPRRTLADDGDDEPLWRPLGEHFYRAACAWAVLDGEPVEALVLDRFLVAAQDAIALTTPAHP